MRNTKKAFQGKSVVAKGRRIPKHDGKLLSEAWVSQEELRKERGRARELRQTPWWRRKVARGVCYYCGRRFPPGELTMDHLVPLARGGRSTKSNCVVSCKECNTKKKTLLPLEWDEYLKGIRQGE